MNPRGVSVIICGYNSAERLPTTLEHVLAQRQTEQIAWEIVIVDNASTDNTAQLAQKILADKGLSFKIVSEPKPGLMNARLKGIQTAQYEYLSFVDDDNWVNPDWVINVFKTFEDYPQVGIIGSQSRPVFEAPKPAWFDDEFQSGFALGKQGRGSGIITPAKPYVWGAGMASRKSIWQALAQQGFKPLLQGRQGNSLLSGEDFEFCLVAVLMDWQIYYNETLCFQHYMPQSRINWDYIRRLHYGFGRTNVYLDIYRSLLYSNIGQKYLKFSPSFVLPLCLQVSSLIKELFVGLLLANSQHHPRRLKLYRKLGAVRELLALNFGYSRLFKQTQDLQRHLRRAKVC